VTLNFDWRTREEKKQNKKENTHINRYTLHTILKRDHT